MQQDKKIERPTFPEQINHMLRVDKPLLRVKYEAPNRTDTPGVANDVVESTTVAEFFLHGLHKLGP